MYLPDIMRSVDCDSSLAQFDYFTSATEDDYDFYSDGISTFKIKADYELKSQRVEEWSEKDVVTWVMHTCGDKYDYENVRLRKFSKINGKILVEMTRDDFNYIDNNIGNYLYDELCKLNDDGISIIDDYKKDKLTTLRPKNVEQWNSWDVVSWIIDECRNDDIDEEKVDLDKFKISGSKLLNLNSEQFVQMERQFGNWLYNKVQNSLKCSNSFENLKITTTYDNTPKNLDSKYPLPEIVQEPIKIKRSPGRPRTSNHVRKKSEKNTGRLWEFIRNLLLNPKFCPSMICWENHDEGVFRFVQSDKVAKLWGSLRGNEKMNYEKLSRAIRYYYKTKVLEAVVGKRLVYKFGPNAKGWRTNNPNFVN